MWTLYDWLETKDMAPTAIINNGSPLIKGVRLHSSKSDGNYAEIQAAEGGSADEEYGTILCFQNDQILLPHVDLAFAHNEALDAFSFYDNWEKDFLLCLLTNDSLQDLLNIAHRVFRRPMFIKNDSSWVYAITKGYDMGVHPDWARMLDNIRGRQSDLDAVKTVSLDPKFQTAFTEKYPCIRHSPFYGDDVLHANVWLKEQRILEVITLSHGKPFNPGDTHLMKFFVQIVHKMIMKDTSRSLFFAGHSSFLASMLENDNYDMSSLNAMLHTFGWHREDEFIVFCVTAQANFDTPILNVLREKLVKKFRYCGALSYKGQVICIVNISKTGALSHILQQAESIIPKTFTWGGSFVFRGLQNFPAYYRQAQFAQTLARETEQPYCAMHRDALKIMSSQIKNLPDFKTFIHPDIRRLRDMDTNTNSHHASTLFEYMLCGGNITDTANRLGLHRNSLIYRINKIRDIITCNLDDMQDRKLLLLSFLFEGEWKY
jgi:hypothetical protein